MAAPSVPSQVTSSGSGIGASPMATGPIATVRRAACSTPSWTTSCVGVRPPVRTAAMRAPHHEMPWWTARPSCWTPASGVHTTSAPKPCSLRHTTSAEPSGDHAKLRCPGPHVGPPCSRASSSATVVPAARSSTVRLSQPPSSERNARRSPVGANRGCCTCTPGPPATVRPGPPATDAITMRLESQGMAGTSHSCHATDALSGDHPGSITKSAEPDSRRTTPPSMVATSTCRSSTE